MRGERDEGRGTGGETGGVVEMGRHGVRGRRERGDGRRSRRERGPRVVAVWMVVG